MLRLKTVVLVVLLMLTFTWSAQAQHPALPHAFYGQVEIQGTKAPVGTSIEARGEGVRTGIPGNPLTVEEEGKYGGAGGFDPKLLVQGGIPAGAPLTFYIDGRQAQCAQPGGEWQDSFPYQAGGITELNLRLPGAGASPTRVSASATATPLPSKSPTGQLAPTVTRTAPAASATFTPQPQSATPSTAYPASARALRPR